MLKIENGEQKKRKQPETGFVAYGKLTAILK